jgi:hypothetical protein
MQLRTTSSALGSQQENKRPTPDRTATAAAGHVAAMCMACSWVVFMAMIMGMSVFMFMAMYSTWSAHCRQGQACRMLLAQAACGGCELSSVVYVCCSAGMHGCHPFSSCKLGYHFGVSGLGCSGSC